MPGPQRLTHPMRSTCMNAKMLPRLQLLENFSDPESQEAEKPEKLREIEEKR